jgi:hypothetical protein
MSQFDSTESDPSDSNPISSGQIETPRGGFMARPGLKAPPRHAVVVRGGDAPESPEIPIARSSFPPPPPASFPPPESLSEKVTLRAIPTPRAAAVVARAAVYSSAAATAPALVTTAATAPTRLPVALESVPPPSDAPVVATVDDERSSSVPRSQRAARSRLTILAAATAGLILGVVSVVTTVHVRSGGSPEPAAAGPVEGASLAAKPAHTAAPPRTRVESSAPASSVGDGRQAAKREPAAPSPSPARGTAVKRSIF